MAHNPVGIVGSGNSARALACYLSSQGCSVHLLTRDRAPLARLARERKLTAVGKLEGTFAIGGIGENAQRFVKTCRTIFIAAVTTAYREIAQRLGPYLTSDHAIILFSSKLAGCVEMSRMLEQNGWAHPVLLETDALFASRIREDGTVWVRGIKQWNLFSAPKCSDTKRHAPIIRRFFPGLEAASNVIQRGLTDFGALAHPATMVANMNSIDRKSPFLFYHEGFTEKTIVVLEQVETEFCRVAKAYGTRLMPAAELLNRYYGCETGNLLDAMRSVSNYGVSYAPTTLDHRFLKEDVACALVPLQGLARKAGVATPTVDAIIQMASLLVGEDFLQTGRTLHKLGWKEMTHAGIMDCIDDSRPERNISPPPDAKEPALNRN